MPRKRARVCSPRRSPRRSSRSPSAPSNPTAPRDDIEEFRWISGLSSRQRVDLVLRRMYAEHRWTIKDLLLHMVMEDTHIPYTASKEKRAKDISKAIFEQPQVTSAIYKASTGLRDI